MKTYQYVDLSTIEIQKICERKGVDFKSIVTLLTVVQNNIKRNGDKALQAYTQEFDGVSLASFLVTKKEFIRAAAQVSEAFKQALAIAAQNIQKFHAEQVFQGKQIETTDGVFCWREARAIETVGLYIPGGTAPLFSTLLMTAIPAQIAGCSTIVICTPPQKDGSVNPEILYTAQMLGLDLVYKVGGAQAIFALAEGTESLPKVDKIFGPGNQYVTAAKVMVSTKLAIDMPAGPSEVLVIADTTSKAEFVASDLLSQAEHGVDSEVVLVTNSKDKADEILTALAVQLKNLPRKEIVQAALKNSFVVLTETLDQAFEFSNIYAPEHLILAFDDFEKFLPKIKNAGSVFCGSLTCESFGDYASGTNHVLPTSGFARNFSGVSVDSFVKKITFQHVTPAGCINLGKTVEILAEKEQLHAHKNAVSLRLKSLKYS
jgi:histidinol dehydrogenase